MNKDRLRKLAQRLDKTKPERFDMSVWCGTACCIAGHALIMQRKPRTYNSDWLRNVMPSVAAYLGLDPKQSRDLMYPRPVELCNFAFAPTPKQAAKVIRHLIKTGEVDWERAMK